MYVKKRAIALVGIESSAHGLIQISVIPKLEQRAGCPCRQRLILLTASGG